jgi:hypothetical protein
MHLKRFIFETFYHLIFNFTELKKAIHGGGGVEVCGEAKTQKA